MATKSYFSQVREAREALKAKALELHDMHLKVIEQALAAENFKAAGEEIRWLKAHMPKEDGVSMVDTDIDHKSAVDVGPKGPQITIGIALGGMPQPKALPSAEPGLASTVRTVQDVIDVEPSDA